MTKLYDYELVYNYLKKMIKDDLNEHDKIPSENQLCEMFNLSRLTVRQGINKLKSEGYLYSRQGSGNFVNPSKIKYNISPYTSFSQEIRKLKKTPSIKLLNWELIKANDFIAQTLGIQKAQQVLYIKNMRFVDGIPFLYAQYYLNLELLPEVDKIIENVYSFSKLYKERYNLDPVRSSSEIDITSTNYESKKIFEVQNDLPIINISTTTIDKKSNKAIDYCCSHFRSDFAKIVIDYKEY